MTPPAAEAAGTTAAPIECETAVRRLWDYLDGRLPTLARDEVEAHLAACAVCPPHFAFARQLRSTLAAAAPPPAGDDDEARLRQRVRRALRRHAADGDARARGMPGRA